MAQTTESHQLADDVGRLYESRAFSDFVVGTSDGQEFHVHRNVLGTRSEVFMAMLTMENSKEVLTGRCEITDVDGPTIDVLLKYMYGTSQFSSLGADNSNALKLLYAAEKYDLPGLVQLCAEGLQITLKMPSVANALLAADRLKLPKLKECALRVTAKDRREFFRSGQLERVREQSVELMEEVLKGVPNSGEIFTAGVYCPSGALQFGQATCAMRQGFDVNVVYP